MPTDSRRKGKTIQVACVGRRKTDLVERNGVRRSALEYAGRNGSHPSRSGCAAHTAPRACLAAMPPCPRGDLGHRLCVASFRMSCPFQAAPPVAASRANCPAYTTRTAFDAKQLTFPSMSIEGKQRLERPVRTTPVAFSLQVCRRALRKVRFHRAAVQHCALHNRDALLQQVADDARSGHRDYGHPRRHRTD
jgi:hypothetical protein